jgi:flagellar motility protein MotE (MotC chaperone)
VKTIRLLPVVVVAAGALLAFKSIGLVTQGGYVLTGLSPAIAAGAAPGHGAPAADPSAGAGEPTLTDSQPQIADQTPTLPSLDAGGHGAETGHGEVAVHGPVADTHSGSAAAGQGCAVEIALTAEGTPAPAHGAAGAGVAGSEECVALADAAPMLETGDGVRTPLTGAGGTPLTDAVLLSRLGDRRAELDAAERQLTMREALVAAAEARIEQRMTALQALEDQISAMVEERSSEVGDQFVAIVTMYEAMKPADAAAILDGLDPSVLLRVARNMSPRKMAPILAAMSPRQAQALTAMLAQPDVEPTPMLSDDFSNLPQIIGR